MLRYKAMVADILGLKPKTGNFVRAINYHEIDDFKGFEKQLRYFQNYFSDAGKDFWQGKGCRLMITFDDGLKSHYQAAQKLEKYGFTGWFFVPSGLVGKTGYLNWDQIKEMSKKHVIGSHTMNHTRMNKHFSSKKLEMEIIDSKKILEKNLGPIDSFCWVGGELRTYTRPAAKLVRKHYRYGFQTCASPIRNNPYHLHRTNIESSWSIPVIRFQLSRLMDLLYTPKKILVENRT